MNERQQTFADESISREEWNWVRDLIQDVEQTAAREEFARRLFQWDLVVRRFRKLELKRAVLGTPTEMDRHYQAACLHALLAFGHALLEEARKVPPDQLEAIRFRGEDLEAYVGELAQSVREINHGFSVAEVAAAQTSIFCAPAEVHS